MEVKRTTIFFIQNFIYLTDNVIRLFNFMNTLIHSLIDSTKDKEYQYVLVSLIIFVNLIAGFIGFLLSSTIAVSCATVVFGHSNDLSNYVSNLIIMNFLAPIMGEMAIAISDHLNNDMEKVVPTVIVMVTLTTSLLGLALFIECWGYFSSLLLLGALRYSVCVTSLSTIFGREIAPDKEMRVIGSANILAGVLGGNGGCHYLSAMGMLQKFNAHEKNSCHCMCLFIFIFMGKWISYIIIYSKIYFRWIIN